MAGKRYYTEGSSARQLNYDDRAVSRRTSDTGSVRRNTSRGGAYVGGSAAPARRYEPERRPIPDSRTKRRPSHLTDEERRALAAKRAQTKAVENAHLRYTASVIAAVVVGVALCCYLLKLTADVKVEKQNVAQLKAQLTSQLDENAGYSAGLDSMTDLDKIYSIATTKLGMVYSKPGQTLYYSQNSDDYVVQYKDVPEAK